MSIEKKKLKSKTYYRAKVYQYNLKKDRLTSTSSRWVDNKQEALKIEYDLKNKLPKNRNEALKLLHQFNNNTYVTEYAKDFFEYKKQYIKKASLLSYKSLFKTHIEPFFTNIRIDEINNNLIFEFQKKLLKKRNVSICRRAIHMLRSLLQYIVTYYNADSRILTCFNLNYTKQVEKKYEILTIEEFNEFVSFFDDNLDALFFKVLFYGGVRLGEVLALTYDDIDYNNNTITINKSRNNYNDITTTKTSNTRTISIPTSIINEIKKIKEQYITTDLIFNRSRKYYTTRLKNKLKKTKINKKITIHSFRHSHASLLINNNMPIVDVSRRLGHKNINITLSTYSHFYDKENKEIINFLNKL